MTRRKFSIMALLGLIGCTRKSETKDTIPVKTADGDGSSEHPFEQKYAHGELDVVTSTLLYDRLQTSSVMKKLFPEFGCCGRCEFPWSIVRSHSTKYKPGSGCFPLCEDCWVELATGANRLPYYMALVDQWIKDKEKDSKIHPDWIWSDYNSDRELIKKAVLAGL